MSAVISCCFYYVGQKLFAQYKDALDGTFSLIGKSSCIDLQVMTPGDVN